MKHTFRPSVTKIGKVREIASVEEIEAEPMLYDCDWDAALTLGGPITKQILSEILYAQDSNFYRLKHREEMYIHIDTKSVMLMPEFYPCIGGWHCDTVPRATGTSQPNLKLMREDVFHCLCIVPSTPRLSNTELLMNDITIDVDESHVWRSVNAAVDNASDKVIMTADDGEVLRFSQSTIHRGLPSAGHGWRYFFRLTFTEQKPKNKIRHQVQVYTAPDTSW